MVASVATTRCEGQVGRREDWACCTHGTANGNSISDQEPSAVTLLDQLTAVDLHGRCELAATLRNVSETFAEVPDGRHTAQALGLLGHT